VTEDEEEDLSRYQMTLKRRDWITLRRREDSGNWKRNGNLYSLEIRFRWGYGRVVRMVVMVKMGTSRLL